MKAPRPLDINGFGVFFTIERNRKERKKSIYGKQNCAYRQKAGASGSDPGFLYGLYADAGRQGRKMGLYFTPQGCGCGRACYGRRQDFNGAPVPQRIGAHDGGDSGWRAGQRAGGYQSMCGKGVRRRDRIPQRQPGISDLFKADRRIR